MSSWSYFRTLLALVVVQVLHRLFQIVDARFVNEMGPELLALHNMQYQFYVFGQFLGIACGTTALIFIGREPKAKAAIDSTIKRLLTRSVMLLIVILLAISPLYFNDSSAVQLGVVGQAIWPYIIVGLMNVALHAATTYFDFFLIGVGQQNRVVWLHAGALGLNILLNDLVVRFVYPVYGAWGIVGIGLGTSIILAAMATIARIWIANIFIENHSESSPTDLVKVWLSETGFIITRALAPLTYVFLLVRFAQLETFINVYSLGMHLAYIFVMPTVGGIQVLLRAEKVDQKMLLNFAFFSFLPFTGLMALGALAPGMIFKGIYVADLGGPEIGFLRMFFVASLIGQIGQIACGFLRRLKKSSTVAAIVFFSEFVVHIGTVATLVFLNSANYETLGMAVLLFATTFTGLAVSMLLYHSKIGALMSTITKGKYVF
jgi:hypothetical protein